MEELAVQGAKISYDKKRFAFSDKEGKFNLSVPDTATQIYVYYDKIGTDTIRISDPDQEIKIVFPYVQRLKEVKVGQKRFSTEISLLSIQKTERITSKELLKAACCNLSESFETTPSVDVAFTDAITGYRQIQLLGLTGPHTLISRENIPDVRGLAAVTGLSFTPGQWIEGMQLSKGVGSVVNGYEGLAGQINVEWLKPMEGDKLFFNLYQNTQGRTEANGYARFEPMEGLYTNVFAHVKSQWLRVDQNHDHYIDQPMGNSTILGNRWMWFGKKGRELQVGAKYTQLNNQGGSMHFSFSEDPALSANWGFKNNSQRIDSWAKLGKVFTHKPWKSMGLQLAHSSYQQDMFFGRKAYTGNEQQAYANYIFQTIVGNTNRVLKLGATTQYTHRHEVVNTDHFDYAETSVGMYGEYAHTFSRKLNGVAGLRYDRHSIYGNYFTPRFHFRYAPTESLAIRLGVGKAYRTATVFAENPGLFATNRTILIRPELAQGAYGLRNENAWNTGVNATYKFTYNYRPGSISVDYYYTHFLNQVVVDWEEARFIKFYNSTQTSFAHSAQIQFDYELFRKLDIRIAARMHDVRVTYEDKLMQRALNAPYRAFMNLGYQTRSKWSFDYTVQWNSRRRIPSTQQNPESLRLDTMSPSFITMNAHVNKVFSKGWEWYAGIENALNYMQQTMIIDGANPFGTYFDASLIWGPTMGRSIYTGIRWRLKDTVK